MQFVPQRLSLPAVSMRKIARTLVAVPVVMMVALGSGYSASAAGDTPSACSTCTTQGYDYSHMVGQNTPPIRNPDGSVSSPVQVPAVLGSEDQKISDQKDRLSAEYHMVLSGRMPVSEYVSHMNAFLVQLGENPEKHVVGDHTGCQKGSECHREDDGSYALPDTKQAANSSSPNAMLSNYISALQQAGEVTTYYCGPSAAWSVLTGLNYTSSFYGEAMFPTSTAQHTLAATCTVGVNGCTDSRGKYDQTDYWQAFSGAGTPWIGEAGNYPMVRALNRWRVGGPTGFYVPKTPTNDTAGIATFKNDLTTDIDGAWPLAANIYEYVGGVHLPGHPNAEIGHWIALRGYNNYGDNTRYADPAYNSAVSWGLGPGMAAFNSVLTASVMVPLVSQRGYVW